ncbi:7TM diverse intracellular signaling domain-containing protein [Pedobacter foliorum]|uniref:sensor histidine kinase n=1 Tax=Pedobacter foliorum TaxID=2739058 RepID=UPI00156657E6|nr:7TM diverse intracellular signaling domain-containing protein [Pedobacter foliorum]NRF41261.1 GHKL domain-containing protein [Pedobacter foliorum]
MFKNLIVLALLITAFFSVKASQISTLPTLYTLDNNNVKRSIKEVIGNKDFQQNGSNILNLGFGNKNYWVKTSIPPTLTKATNLILFIDQSRLSFVEVYYVKDNKVLLTQHLKNYNLIAPINTIGNVGYYHIPKALINADPEIYINIVSNELFVAPVIIQTQQKMSDQLIRRDLIFGLYTGALLIMFLYNLFLFFSVRDKSYVFYVFYILFTWLSQISVQGFASKYFWPDSLWLHQHSVTLFSLIALISGLSFSISFLNTQQLVPRCHKLLQALLGFSILSLFLSLTSYAHIAFALMQLLTALSCITALIIAGYVYFKQNIKPAGYYLLAWTVLTIGICMFIAKDYRIIPYNIFTIYILQIASVIEVTLLSFALADKINIFKKEKEQSQADALRILIENEKLVREQNVLLEIKVKERTEALENTNQNLNDVLVNLKEAQSQLVDAEKMAGLGQLTAGIAHEINNPINFVTSNIKPLELDINELDDVIHMYEKLDLNGNIEEQLGAIENFKKRIDINFVRSEIKSLLSGIGDGARRTAEIIRSLKNFSRLDENDTKPVDLNEGLDSTLILIRSTFPSNLKIIKDYEVLPLVECMPGKMNQVFMNLITNAIYAIKSKPEQNEEEFVTIKTWQEGNHVKISIKDSGTGMPEDVRQKIFEPFFTTKDVGEGTGLGLSIVFRIIENHHGNIDVVTKLNQGTEFIITLPVN